MDEQSQFVALTNFGRGVVGRRENPLAWPQDALRAGKNFLLADGGLVTRSGYGVVSDESLPAGEVQVVKQARFPSNESKYTVAQVKTETVVEDRVWEDSTANPDDALSDNKAAWDSSRGLLWKYGGGYDLVAYSWDTDSWNQFTTTGGPDQSIIGYGIIYDPVGDRLILHGGKVGAVYQSAVWEYDIDADTWAELTCTGTAPVARSAHLCVYNSEDRTMVVMAGSSASLYYADPYYELDLTTLVWTEVTVVGDYPGSVPGTLGLGTGPAGIYMSDTNSVFAMGGSFSETCCKEGGILDLTTQTWTLIPSPDWGALDFTCGGSVAFRCEGSDTIYMTHRGYTVTYSISGAVWSEVSDDETNPDTPNNVAVTDDGHVIIEEDGTVLRLPDFCPGGDWGTTPGFNRLYASDDELPETAATFTKIADLSEDAEPISTAILQDRMVYANIKDVPGSWGGCMASDGSDWMFPIMVLAFADGVYGEDITSTVCDADPETSLLVTLTASGYLDICTDFATLTGLYFDMAVANTGLSGASAAFAAAVNYTDDTYAERLDLKATITTYTRDGVSAGHFDQINALVTTGCLIVFDDATTATVISKANDGTGASDIGLDSDHATGNIDYIYAISVSEGRVGPHFALSAFSDIWTKTLAGNSNHPMTSVRQVLTAAEITSDCTGEFKITMKSGSQYGTVLAFSGLVKRDSGANGTAVPTQVTWNNGSIGFSIGANTQITSDPIIGDIDGTKDYLFCYDLVGTTYTIQAVAEQIITRPSYTFSVGTSDSSVAAKTTTTIVQAAQPARTVSVCGIGSATGGGFYYKAWTGEESTATYDQQTVTGFTTVANYCVGITKVEANTVHPITPNAQVSHTTSANQVDLAHCGSFSGVAITEETPGNSLIHHAVSFDGRLTFKIWKTGAWLTIVQNDGANWEYWDGAAYQNATTNSLMGALTQGLAVAGNKILGSVYEGLTAANWIDTGGLDLTVNRTLDFAQLFTPDGQNIPRLTGYAVSYDDLGTVRIDVRQAGVWVPITATDNTDVGGVSLGQSGTVTFPATTADCDVVDGAAGFHFRLWTNGTSAGTAIAQIKFRAAGQALQNIGNGQPDTVMGAIFYDTSEEQAVDFAVQGVFSDYIETDLSKADIPMEAGDYFYIGYLTRFNALELTPLAGSENSVVSILTVEAWNGESWVALTKTDGTSKGGATLHKKGIVTWTLPTTWKTNIPLNGDYGRGYWVRLSVSVALTAGTALVEARVYPVPDALVKHRFAAVMKNRLALIGRTDKTDQLDISRAGEPWGFCGPDSASGRAQDRLGGEGQIQAVFGGWDGLFMGQPETWHQLTGNSPSQFNLQTVEASRHVPINSRCIVKAPMPGGDDGSKNAVIFANQYGCFAAMGIQADGSFASGRVVCLSEFVSWWQPGSTERIDMDYAHLMCMEYWPIDNLILIAAPFITDGSTPQTTNNYLLCFDVTLQAWLPPQDIPVASMCLAYETNNNAPGGYGSLELLAGDYSGRILRLFNGDDDNGTDIEAIAETGNLDFGAPQWQKRIRWLRIFGVTAGTSVTVSIYLDGAATAADTWTFTNVASPGTSEFIIEPASANLLANFFRFKIEATGQTTIHGIELIWYPERDREGTGV